MAGTVSYGPSITCHSRLIAGGPASTDSCFVCDPLNAIPADAALAPQLCGPGALSQEIQNALIENAAIKPCSNCYIQETTDAQGSTGKRPRILINNNNNIV